LAPFFNAVLEAPVDLGAPYLGLGEDMVTGYGLRVTGFGLRVSGYRLSAASLYKKW